jgi:hypothetical protein
VLEGITDPVARRTQKKGADLPPFTAVSGDP